MPSVWCSKWARDDAVLFNGLSIRDVTNVIRADKLARKPIGDYILCCNCDAKCLGFVVTVRVPKF